MLLPVLLELTIVELQRLKGKVGTYLNMLKSASRLAVLGKSTDEPAGKIDYTYNKVPTWVGIIQEHQSHFEYADRFFQGIFHIVALQIQRYAGGVVSDDTTSSYDARFHLNPEPEPNAVYPIPMPVEYSLMPRSTLNLP